MRSDKEETVLTDDEVIAKFMGVRSQHTYGPLTGELYIEVKLTQNANWQVAHYKKSWDWLMPVCIKLGMTSVSTDITKTYKDVVNRIMEIS